ncbi:unnamed protein product [Paramecium sonneborni]|uniref:Uncharacterized protein n=1 Tax=Paramecium sonneborni TaxID=65129 RepID=A0A8S1NKE0_9CILI|nr:unnamed protein product [Paramecium sonneborni]
MKKDLNFLKDKKKKVKLKPSIPEEIKKIIFIKFLLFFLEIQQIIKYTNQIIINQKLQGLYEED